jgi:hypothetical protein
MDNEVLDHLPPALEHLVLAILPSILFINGMQVMPGV